MDEVNEFSDWLRRQKGQSVSLQERFALAVVNSLWKILSGERFDHDDAQLHKILVDLHTLGKTNNLIKLQLANKISIIYFILDLPMHSLDLIP